jgi:hypothetical protein
MCIGLGDCVDLRNLSHYPGSSEGDVFFGAEDGFLSLRGDGA